MFSLSGARSTQRPRPLRRAQRGPRLGRGRGARRLRIAEGDWARHIRKGARRDLCPSTHLCIRKCFSTSDLEISI